MQIKTLVFTLLLLCCNNAYSLDFNGHTLLKSCDYTGGGTKDQDGFGLYCLGVIKGTTDMNDVYRNIWPDKRAFFCPPDNIKFGEYQNIIVKYLKNNTEILHKRDNLLILRALIENYPCPTSKKQ